MNAVENAANMKPRMESAVARTGRVASKDGTAIVYDRVGSGPAVVLVDGALCTRSFGPMPKLAAELARDFTVFTYDRRGRGESGDAAPYEVEREVEDLAAVIAEAGGAACVYGTSSGAMLALRAAACGVAMTKLALYEAPVVVDGSRPSMDADWAKIDAALAAGDRGAAVRTFLRAIGVPGFVLAIMRWLPVWKNLTATAPTLPYDGRIVGEYQRGGPLPAGRWAGATMPVLALDGGKSAAWMRAGMAALAKELRAERRTLDGQGHDVDARVLAPVLRAFFKG